MKKLLYIFLFFSAVLTACNSDEPDILSSGEMEDILYDFHLAQSMDGQGTSEERALVEIRNREAILRKHDVTDAEWDSSYSYYCRHSQELYVIYKNLSERVRNELIAMGGSVSAVDGGVTGDTTNIWNTDADFILMQHTPYNIKSFDVVADTTYKAGDKFILQFNDKYIFQDGLRDLVVMLAVTFKNDSVAFEVRHVSSDGINTVNIDDAGRLGVKDVRGYFLLSRNINDVASTTLRFISLSDVKLIRMHNNQPPVDENRAKPDSSNVGRKDSVQQNSGGSQSSQPVPNQTEGNGSVQHVSSTVHNVRLRTLRPAPSRPD